MNDNSDHWLVRPDTIRKLKIALWVACGLVIAADFLVHHHVHFGIDGVPTFFAWFAFLSCVVMVFVAKALGALLRRKDTYYDD